MTTIVATPTAIYSDSQCSFYTPFATFKLRHIVAPKDGTDYLVGGAGDITELQFLCNLIETYGLVNGWRQNLDADWPPRLLKKMETDVLIVTREGSILLMDNKLTPVIVDEPFYCLGTGGDLAIAALDHGRTPEEAIEYACTRDEYSSPPIHKLEFPDAD